MTDDEIKDCLVSVAPETKRLPPGFRDFARAILAAHEAKLREGVEAPERFPAGYIAQSEYFVQYDDALRYGDARALAARDAKSKTCTWSQVDCFDMPGVYDTGCNNAWSFTEGDLSDNKIKYCPFCSGHIDAAMKRGEA